MILILILLILILICIIAILLNIKHPYVIGFGQTDKKAMTINKLFATSYKKYNQHNRELRINNIINSMTSEYNIDNSLIMEEIKSDIEFDTDPKQIMIIFNDICKFYAATKVIKLWPELYLPITDRTDNKILVIMSINTDMLIETDLIFNVNNDVTYIYTILQENTIFDYNKQKS